MNYNELFGSFNRLRILVIGDVMIDAYLLGKVNRVSPEAPVPIVSLSKQEERLGGAANVAVNLIAMGAQAIICSCVGNDREGETLTGLLKNAGISDDGLVRSAERMTTVKTRVLGNHQHLLRIDSEQTNNITVQEEDAILQKVQDLIAEGLDAIIFEDYNKGVLTPRVIEEVIRMAREKGIPTTVDPKKENFFAYKGVTLFKPNLKELKEGTGIDFTFNGTSDLFEKAVLRMEDKLGNTISFITLSEHGVFIRNGQEAYHCRAHVRNIADVSGAGDTVIAVATLCLAAGATLRDIAEIANLAGGLVCEESGVVSIDKQKLLSETEKLIVR